MQHPNLYIIAGPNGAGKTTVSYNLLPNAHGDAILVAKSDSAIGDIQVYEKEMWNQIKLKI